MTSPNLPRFFSEPSREPSPPEAALRTAQGIPTPMSSPFTIRNLLVLAYAQGFTLWHYKSGSTPLAEVQTPDFFSSACDMFTLGDFVLISGPTGGAVVIVTQLPSRGDKSGTPVEVSPLGQTTPAGAE